MEMPNASNPIATRNHDLIGMAITHVPTGEGRMIQRCQSTLILSQTYGDAPKSHHPPYRFSF